MDKEKAVRIISEGDSIWPMDVKVYVGDVEIPYIKSININMRPGEAVIADISVVVGHLDIAAMAAVKEFVPGRIQRDDMGRVFLAEVED